ncbi:hypothetical protein [Lysobacter sp. CA196]|uniref:hypothetical protein n=1 Tax=Lysobacter sp. CA196 TaxID=3455606 RepID=UPI003F8D7117
MNYASLEKAAPRLTLLATLGVFVALMFPLLKSYPFSDDWSYLAVLPAGSLLTLDWVFGLHNDHRIPIQKLLHYLLLKSSGGDFRLLMMLNMAFAAVTAYCWMQIACLMRDGRRSFGDAVIPLILLGGGFNAVSWGFSFQFVSSVAFVSLSAWFAIWYLRGLMHHGVEYAFICLTLCAWSGANGIISSGLLGAALVLLCAWELRRQSNTRRFARLSSVALWFLTLGGLIATWRPSGATSQSENGLAENLPPFVLGMSKSWMGVFAVPLGTVKLIAALAILCVASLLALWLFWGSYRRRERHAFEHLVILAVLGQTVATILVVAVSRAVAQPWTPWLELHYGFLTTLIPLAAWAILSRHMPRRIERFASVVLIVFAGQMYYANTSWRIRSLREGYPKVAAAQAALLSSQDPSAAVNENMSEYYYLDNPDARKAITGAIPLLRQVPLWQPGPQTPQR